MLKKIFLVFVILSLSVSCAKTKQANKVKVSGFLGDYSSLREGRDEEALLRYVNPNANIKNYDSFVIEPISIWMSEDSTLAKMKKNDRQKLANNFYNYLREDLGKVLTLVDKPTPTTIRIQVALTDVGKARPVLDTVSTFVPVTAALNVLKTAVGMPASLVGDASAEIKITDAYTGELLAAAVDKRIGGKSVDPSLSKWKDVDAAMKYWSELLAYRICERKKMKDCKDPF